MKIQILNIFEERLKIFDRKFDKVSSKSVEIFQSGGPRFVCDAGGCLRGDVPPSEVGAFFENVGSNEAI